MLGMEDQGTGKVSYPLVNDAVLLCECHSMDVSPRTADPKHFTVDHTDKVFPHLTLEQKIKKKSLNKHKQVFHS